MSTPRFEFVPVFHRDLNTSKELSLRGPALHCLAVCMRTLQILASQLGSTTKENGLVFHAHTSATTVNRIHALPFPPVFPGVSSCRRRTVVVCSLPFTFSLKERYSSSDSERVYARGIPVEAPDVTKPGALNAGVLRKALQRRQPLRGRICATTRCGGGDRSLAFTAGLLPDPGKGTEGKPYRGGEP